MPKEERTEQTAPKAEKRTPDEWAKARGYLLSPNVPANEVLGTGPHWAWQHAAASALHGWRSHEFHAGSPLLLTEDDYSRAVDSACAPEGNPKPYKPAASKYLKD